MTTRLSLAVVLVLFLAPLIGAANLFQILRNFLARNDSMSDLVSAF